MKKLISILAILSVPPLMALASLEWKKQAIDYTAEPGDESVTADFYFANTGDKLVHIVGTKTSCGCTVANLDKDSYLPGEMGTLKVKFTFDGRTGHQAKEVAVYSDDPMVPITTLRLNVDIPGFMSVEPQLLFWTNAEKPAPKSAIIAVLSSNPIFIVKEESDNPNFSFDLTRLEDGRSYRLTVTPKSTAAPTQGQIKLTTTAGKDEAHPRVALVTLQVY